MELQYVLKLVQLLIDHRRVFQPRVRPLKNYRAVCIISISRLQCQRKRYETMELNLFRMIYYLIGLFICSHQKPVQDNDYELIRPSYKITSPVTRPAPKPPVPIKSHGTLSVHSEVEGVPFILNPNLNKNNTMFEVF